MSSEIEHLESIANREYKYGFVTDIEAESLPPGLNEDTIRAISAFKEEPGFMTEWRLKAYRQWLKMVEPKWPKVEYPDIDFQKIVYYSAPKKGPKYQSLDEVDPELLKTYDRLGIPLGEQKLLAGVAVDAVLCQ